MEGAVKVDNLFCSDADCHTGDEGNEWCGQWMAIKQAALSLIVWNTLAVVEATQWRVFLADITKAAGASFVNKARL